MDSSERQLHLGLHARDLRDTESRRLVGDVPKQSRLSDAGLAPNDQDPALTVAHLREESVEPLALARPVKEPRRERGCHG
jgi:hypothetical protein